MALIKTAPIVSDLRGSIGGVTFSRSRHGLTARRRVKPTRGASDSQSRARAAFSIATAYWRTDLTESDRLAWNAAATTLNLRNALGEPSNPSGFGLFMRINLPRMIGGPALTDTPPAVLIAQWPSVYIYWNEGALRFQLLSVINQFPVERGTIRWWFSPDFSPSRYHPGGPWTYDHAELYMNGMPISIELTPSPPSFRPCRRFYQIRVQQFVGNAFSTKITFPAYCPPAP